MGISLDEVSSREIVNLLNNGTQRYVPYFDTYASMVTDAILNLYSDRIALYLSDRLSEL